MNVILLMQGIAPCDMTGTMLHRCNFTGMMLVQVELPEFNPN